MVWNDVVGISFDLGGTLIHDRHGPATQEIGDLFGVGLAQMRVHLGRDAKRNRQSTSDLARRLVTDFGRPELAPAVIRVLEQRRTQSAKPRLFPHAEAVVTELRQRGYRIAFLSNVLGAIAPPAGYPFFRLADAVLMSCDTGCVKPERAAFAQVELALDADPSQLAHVGDAYAADVRGALAAGWHAVWMRRTDDATANGPGAAADNGAWCELADLQALLALFRTDRCEPRAEGGVGE
jgi:FMN hydrolase / 5-amino-6-(5-phospho-D-ribitylamino)uracil phosphatase